MTAALGARYAARILGQIDTSKLVDIDPLLNQGAANRASQAAMRALLNTAEVDFYLVNVSRGRSPRATRYRHVPFDTSGVAISGGRQADGSVWIWLDADLDRIRIAVDDPDAATPPPLSAVTAALLFRELFGAGPREFDLGPDLGIVAFTPTMIEVNRTAELPLDQRHIRFPYSDPGLSNYVQYTPNDSLYGVWMWLTDPTTGLPGDKWWKVSHILNNAGDAVSLRLDDPAEPPPMTPPLLEVVEHGSAVPIVGQPSAPVL